MWFQMVCDGLEKWCRGEDRNFIRLNCAQPWNEALDKAVMTVGRMIDAMV
jgi:DNA-binding transcriptional MocR family regulator